MDINEEKVKKLIILLFLLLALGVIIGCTNDNAQQPQQNAPIGGGCGVQQIEYSANIEQTIRGDF